MPLDETTATIQHQAATDIAADRFNFPNDEHPNLETSVNIPTLTQPVEGPNGELLGPDIVVVDDQGLLQIVAAVETVHTLNEMTAKVRWSKFARLDVPFYLYVPAGHANEAKKLLKGAGVGATLRTWRYIQGLNQTLDITDITRDFSIFDIMPPFLHDIAEKRRERAAIAREERKKVKAQREAEETAREEEKRLAREEDQARREAELESKPEYPHTTAPRR